MFEIPDLAGDESMSFYLAILNLLLKNFTVCVEKEKTTNRERLRKKTRAEEIRLPDFRLYYIAAVIKTVLYWNKSRNIDQWNRIESPEINLHIYGQLISYKGGKTTQWRKESSSMSGSQKTRQLHVKKEERN